MLSIRHLDHVGAALHQLRTAARFTQADVAARTGLKSPQLSRWENGHDEPTLESLVRYLGAIGASLADFERVLLGKEDEERSAALAKELRQIRAGHGEKIAASMGLRLEVERILKRNREGLERRTAGRGAAAAASKDAAAEDVTAEEGIGSELADLLAGLPEGLHEVLKHPARRSPAVVERLIEKGWEWLAGRRRQAYYAAGAAARLAAELPRRFSREVRYTLRGRSLELWGTVQRRSGRRAPAEAALLSSFELLAQTGGADPPDLAVVLGRCALVASEFERGEDLARYAAEAVRIARAVDRAWPLPTFLHLFKTVMDDPKPWEPGVRWAEALFGAAREAWGGFEDEPWEMALEITDRGDAGREIRLERRGPLAGLPSWTLDEPLVWVDGGKRD